MSKSPKHCTAVVSSAEMRAEREAAEENARRAREEAERQRQQRLARVRRSAEALAASLDDSISATQGQPFAAHLDEQRAEDLRQRNQSLRTRLTNSTTERELRSVLTEARALSRAWRKAEVAAIALTKAFSAEDDRRVARQRFQQQRARVASLVEQRPPVSLALQRGLRPLMEQATGVLKQADSRFRDGSLGQALRDLRKAEELELELQEQLDQPPDDPAAEERAETMRDAVAKLQAMQKAPDVRRLCGDELAQADAKLRPLALALKETALSPEAETEIQAAVALLDSLPDLAATRRVAAEQRRIVAETQAEVLEEMGLVVSLEEPRMEGGDYVVRAKLEGQGSVKINVPAQGDVRYEPEGFGLREGGTSCDSFVSVYERLKAGAAKRDVELGPLTWEGMAAPAPSAKKSQERSRRTDASRERHG